jgi:hypothetical protein
MPDKTTTRAMSKEDEFKAELDEMLKDFDKYDNANKDEIQLIKTAMGQVKLMLQSKLIEARKLSEVEIELKKCQEETKKLNEQMKDIKSSLGI